MTEAPNMTRIEETNFGPGYSSQNQLDSINEQNSLTAYNFGGLFILIGSTMIFALFFSKTSAGKKLIVMAIHFTHKFFSFLPFGRNDMRTTTTIVHANVSSEVEVEVELSKQNNPSNSDVSAAVPKDNESDQSNDNDESQKPSPGNVDVAGR